MEKLNETTEPDTAPLAEAAASEPIEEVVRLKDENEKLRAEIRLGEAHRQITAELGLEGAHSPELLFSSIRGDLQFADDGSLLNAAALVADLKTRFPEQFRQPAAAVSIDAGTGSSRPAAISREALANMSPAEIAKLDWEEVRRVLSK